VKSFILGAITGGTIVWFWGPEIRDFIDEQTKGLRDATGGRLQRAADGLHSAAEGLQAARSTIEGGLGGA
jgi:hypothetical protein